ncbi:hypothetical protein GCM10023336_20490 [Streptomyces similanensis]|uniref:Uncharacterized protein n=1 Tax=Streptomyces similanensis TaxID=1274988 RepID=A0ABP9K573_9ACTN
MVVVLSVDPAAQQLLIPVHAAAPHPCASLCMPPSLPGTTDNAVSVTPPLPPPEIREAGKEGVEIVSQ